MPRLAPVRSNVLRGALWDEVAMNWFSVCAIPGGIDFRIDAYAPRRNDVGVKGTAAFSTRIDPAYRGGIRCDRANGTGGRARIRTAAAQRASRSSRAGAAPRRSCIGRRP